MGFTDIKALDIYYGADRKPRDINGEQISIIGEDGSGAHLATEIRFHFTAVGQLGQYHAVTAVAKRSDGQMRYDLCERVGTGTDAYYVLELNNWYLEKWGSLLLDVKVYTNTSYPVVTISEAGVLSTSTGTKIILGSTFKFNVNYVPQPTTQVEADELSSIEAILALVEAKPYFQDVIRLSTSFPVDLSEPYDWEEQITDAIRTITYGSQPLTSVTGDYWYNPLAHKLYVYDIDAWSEVTVTYTASTEPTPTGDDQIWVDETAHKIYFSYDTGYVANAYDGEMFFIISADGVGKIWFIDGETPIEVDFGVNKITFTNDGNGATTDDTGKLYWDNAYGTLTLGLYDDVSLQIGQEIHIYGKASVAISDGDVVQYAGKQGNHIMIKPAVPSEINAMPQLVLGLATQNITKNYFGYVTTFGRVNKIDTSAYTQGDILYFASDGVVNGAVTNVKPSAPNAKIVVGVIDYVHAEQGILFIRLSINPLLSELSNVDISNVADKDILAYDGTKWINSNRLTTAEETLALIVDTGGIEVNKYASYEAFPPVGSDLRLYLARDTNKMYHWETNAYVKVADDVNIDTGTDKGIVFYDATQGKIDTDTTTKLDNGDIISSKNIFTIKNSVSNNNIYIGDDAVEINSYGNIGLSSPQQLDINGKTYIWNSVAIEGDTDAPSLIITNASTPNANSLLIQGYDNVEQAKIDKDGVITAKGLTINGDAEITGDLTVSGTTTTINTTEVNIADNMIKVNSDLVPQGTNGSTIGQASTTNTSGGLEVKRYEWDGDSWEEANYNFIFDEASGLFKIGETASLQSVATRQDSPTSNGVPYWNDTAKRFDTSANFVVDTADNANAGLLINKSAGNGYIQTWQFGGVNKAHVIKNGDIYTSNVFIGNGWKNASSVNNAYYEASNNGAVISRNIADAYPALIVDSKLGTSNIAEFRFGGANKLEITKDGFIYQNGNRFIHNYGTGNTFLGVYSGNHSLAGSSNTGIGYASLTAISSGVGNTSIGASSGRFIADGTTVNTTSDYSVYLGASTRASADNAQNEIVIGYNAIGQGSNSVVLGNTDITKVFTNGGLDVSNGSIALLIGADNEARTRTNSTLKFGRLASYHYTNTEEPLGLIVGYSDSASSQVRIGGGSSLLNSATKLSFYTAANTTTTSGTERLTIDSAGNVGVNKAIPTSQLHVVSSAVDKVGLIVDMPTSATANIQQWKIAGTTNAAYIDAYGTIFTGLEQTTAYKNKWYGLLGNSAGNVIATQFTQRWNGSAYVADYSNGFGYLALYSNTGAYSNGFGQFALQNNMGSSSNGFGIYALYSNTGSSSNGFGHSALYSNTGSSSNGFGYATLYNNTGAYSNGVGNSALYNNTGANSNGFGYAALRYNQGAYNTAIGDSAFNLFYDNTAGNKTCDYTAVDIANEQLTTITNHGFGATNAFVNIKYASTTGDPIGGLTVGSIYQVKIIDADTIEFRTGSTKLNLTSQGTGTHTFTPQYTYTNSTAIGYNAQPTASNQIVLGDANITSVKTTGAYVSTIATGTAPLTVSSTTLVSNLNADLLDGNEASAFATSDHTQAVNKGGTNFTTYAKGDILYSDATNSLAKLTIGDENQVLSVSATGIPTWKTGGTSYAGVTETNLATRTTVGTFTVTALDDYDYIILRLNLSVTNVIDDTSVTETYTEEAMCLTSKISYSYTDKVIGTPRYLYVYNGAKLTSVGHENGTPCQFTLLPQNTDKTSVTLAIHGTEPTGWTLNVIGVNY